MFDDYACSGGRHANIIMDAAREAGVVGGTIVRAKDAGGEKDCKFFGVSIASEKEIIIIVTKAKIKRDESNLE